MKSFAGAGKAVIRIPKVMLPLEGFQEQLDDLHARVIYLHASQDWIIVSLEMTSVREYEIEVLKTMLYDVAKVEKEHIWITVTHTFSVPHTRSLEALQDPDIQYRNTIFCKAIEQAVLQAYEQAKKHLTEVTIEYGVGSCKINCNRDQETPQGWWLVHNEEGFSDFSVPVVVCRDRQNHIIAVLYSYDIQSSVLDGMVKEDDTRLISSDVTGKASDMIEKQMDTVAIYLLGGAADQEPMKKAIQTKLKDGKLMTMDQRQYAIRYVEEQGHQLGQSVLDTLNGLTYVSESTLMHCKRTISCPAQRIAYDMRKLHPVKKYDFIEDGVVETPIEILILGDIAIVAVQPELCSETTHQIKANSPYEMTMVVTMVNGGAKYMANQKAYDHITYEAMNSKFAKGSAELLCEELLKMMKERKGNLT